MDQNVYKTTNKSAPTHTTTIKCFFLSDTFLKRLELLWGVIDDQISRLPIFFFFYCISNHKTSPQYISISLLQIPLRLYEHRGSYWRKKPPWTILEEQFRVPVPRTTAASKVGDHNKFSSLSNTTVMAIFEISVYGDIVYSQTWEVSTLKNCIELP